MKTEQIYMVHGISQREKMLLETDSNFSFEEEEIPDGALGEPATFMLLAMGISTLAAYLLKKNNDESFEETISIKMPDGTIETRTVKWIKSSSEAPGSEIIAQIQSVFRGFL